MSNLRILAIVIDGFHEGHTVRMEYHPTLKLLKPRVERVDYCCEGADAAPIYIDRDNELEYKECFRSVDRDIVLYSTTGKSTDIFGWFGKEVSSRPWTRRTTLKMGYHNEPVIRRDENVLPTAPFSNFPNSHE